jgi:hypothetical protein
VTDLRDRPAAYEVIRECLARQAARPPRGTLAKIFGLSPVRSEDASWYQGALGEQAVGRQLARISSEWTVLHAIPVGAGESDIDHLLIGPADVFTLNTKRHRGKKIWVADQRILVSGQKVDHLRNARYEASRASKLLSRARGRTVPVSAALVFVAVDDITFKTRPRDVHIWTERSLLRHLKKLKPQLHPDEVAAIVDVAVRDSTWSSKPTAPVQLGLLAEFADLVRVEGVSWRIRIAWLLALLVAALVLGVPLLMGLLSSILLRP